MMMLARAVLKDCYAENASDKESESVRTMESSEDEDEDDNDDSECGYSEGSLEEIDLLNLGGEDHDNDDDFDGDYCPSFYCDDDDMDLLEQSTHKNTCVQRALSGFTGVIKSLANFPPHLTATNSDAHVKTNVTHRMDPIMTDAYLITECFDR